LPQGRTDVFTGGSTIVGLGRYNDGNITDDALRRKCFSVNSHRVDRLTRKRITLNHPWVSASFGRTITLIPVAKRQPCGPGQKPLDWSSGQCFLY
jgi:hypothetical protein